MMGKIADLKINQPVTIRGRRGTYLTVARLDGGWRVVDTDQRLHAYRDAQIVEKRR